jgi:hypothetical protein
MPNEVTTTSVKVLSRVDKAALIEFLSPIGMSCSAIPIAEKVRVFELAGIVRENVPSSFEVVPNEVPFTVTEAFGMGFPFSSVTFPVIVRL